MKKLFKRIFLKRMLEADLNGEAIRAAGFYIKKAGAVPLKEKQDMLNYVAHGFYMGVRWMEDQNGASRRTEEVAPGQAVAGKGN